MSNVSLLPAKLSNIITNMNFNSKKTLLVILGLTSIICSRAMFFFFDDPEGPNLLVVIVMAAIIYALSLLSYRYCFSTIQDGLKKLLLTVFVQVIVTVGFYFFL